MGDVGERMRRAGVRPSSSSRMARSWGTIRSRSRKGVDVLCRALSGGGIDGRVGAALAVVQGRRSFVADHRVSRAVDLEHGDSAVRGAARRVGPCRSGDAHDGRDLVGRVARQPMRHEAAVREAEDPHRFDRSRSGGDVLDHRREVRDVVHPRVPEVATGVGRVPEAAARVIDGPVGGCATKAPCARARASPAGSAPKITPSAP